MNRGEALNALYAGQKVRYREWLSENYIYNHPIHTIVDGEGAILGAEEVFRIFFLDDFDDWELYEEPAKSLTYDEAVASEKVRIYWQDETVTYTRDHEHWYLGNLQDFDFAERRGYRMERVD